MLAMDSNSPSFFEKVGRFVAFVLLVGAGAGVGIYFATRPVDTPETEENALEGNVEASENAEEGGSISLSDVRSPNGEEIAGGIIKDENIGVEFKVSEDLTRAVSPNYLYYFEVLDVPQINCSLNSKWVDAALDTGEVIDTEINILLGELSGSYDDVSDSQKKAFKLGDGVGIRLNIDLGREGVSLKRTDQFGVVGGKLTHMKCEAPTSLYKVFESKFNAMLDSLRISE